MTQRRAGHVLAANLKEVRERRGLSLSGLARRSGLAKGTLSQLESGSGNPTIETVFGLSNALNVPVSSLLAPPEDNVVLVRSAALEVRTGSTVDLRLLRRLDVTKSVLEVDDQRVRPGPQQHSEGHAGIEHVTVVTGRLLVGPPESPTNWGLGIM